MLELSQAASAHDYLRFVAAARTDARRLIVYLRYTIAGLHTLDRTPLRKVQDAQAMAAVVRSLEKVRALI
jgi:hypothetical protein